jgi:hypothetical protein
MLLLFAGLCGGVDFVAFFTNIYVMAKFLKKRHDLSYEQMCVFANFECFPDGTPTLLQFHVGCPDVYDEMIDQGTPTLDQIRKWALARAKRHGRVRVMILHYVNHGSKQRLGLPGIPGSFDADEFRGFLTMLHGLVADHVLVILDCCNAAKFAKKVGDLPGVAYLTGTALYWEQKAHGTGTEDTPKGEILSSRFMRWLIRLVQMSSPTWTLSHMMEMATEMPPSQETYELTGAPEVLSLMVSEVFGAGTEIVYEEVTKARGPLADEREDRWGLGEDDKPVVQRDAATKEGILDVFGKVVRALDLGCVCDGDFRSIEAPALALREEVMLRRVGSHFISGMAVPWQLWDSEEFLWVMFGKLKEKLPGIPLAGIEEKLTSALDEAMMGL